jgi:hypothetical protein
VGWWGWWVGERERRGGPGGREAGRRRTWRWSAVEAMVAAVTSRVILSRMDMLYVTEGIRGRHPKSGMRATAAPYGDHGIEPERLRVWRDERFDEAGLRDGEPPPKPLKLLKRLRTHRGRGAEGDGGTAGEPGGVAPEASVSAVGASTGGLVCRSSTSDSA